MLVLMQQVLHSQNTGQNCDDRDGIYQYKLANLEFFEYELERILYIKG